MRIKAPKETLPRVPCTEGHLCRECTTAWTQDDCREAGARADAGAVAGGRTGAACGRRLRAAALRFPAVLGHRPKPTLAWAFAGASVHRTFAFCRLTHRTFVLIRFTRPHPLRARSSSALGARLE
ncbi:MAG: hypothetical protein FVQ76_01400 [Nitrospira sp.]|nr:hypothetical protein [Nitrospira sp.]